MGGSFETISVDKRGAVDWVTLNRGAVERLDAARPTGNSQRSPIIPSYRSEMSSPTISLTRISSL